MSDRPGNQTGGESPRKTGASPLDALNLAVAMAWQTVLTQPEETNFFGAGGDSLAALELAKRVEVATGRTPPMELVYEFPDLPDFIEAVRACPATGHPDSLVRLAPATVDGPVLVCLHSITGTAFRYGILAQHLPGVGMYGFQSAQLLAQASAELDVQSLVHGYALRWLSESRPPVVVLGYSFGAVLAREFAVELDMMGSPAIATIMIDPASPAELQSSADPLVVLLATLGLEPPEGVQGRHATLAHAANVVSARTGARPVQVAELEQTLKAMEHLISIIPTSPMRIPASPVYQIGARIAPRQKWDGLAGYAESPGDHFTLFSPANVAGLAEQIRAFASSASNGSFGVSGHAGLTCEG